MASCDAASIIWRALALGIEKAKWICVSMIDTTQLFVAFYLRAIGEAGPGGLGFRA